jgi:hypothetical protein
MRCACCTTTPSSLVCCRACTATAAAVATAVGYPPPASAPESKSLKSVRSESGKEAASGRQVAQAAAKARQGESVEMLGNTGGLPGYRPTQLEGSRAEPAGCLPAAVLTAELTNLINSPPACGSHRTKLQPGHPGGLSASARQTC